jgi:hypothetical protein
MVFGSFTDLTYIKSGLGILRGYNADAAIVVRYPLVHVPEILLTDLSGLDQTAITNLGWIDQSVEGGLFYTLTN